LKKKISVLKEARWISEGSNFNTVFSNFTLHWKQKRKQDVRSGRNTTNWQREQHWTLKCRTVKYGNSASSFRQIKRDRIWPPGAKTKKLFRTADASFFFF
jgi:hypothetical protein